MKKAFLTIALILPLLLGAQHLEVGIMVGASNYDGDMSPSSIGTRIGDTRPAFGGFARLNFNNYLAARFSANFASELSTLPQKTPCPALFSFQHT